MTNHEIEKLAKESAYEYLGINPKAKSLQARDAQDVNIFEAGYLKGVESERDRCIKIVNKIIEKEVSPFGARTIKEQIERGE